MEYCKDDRHEFVLPEHLLLAMMDDKTFVNVLNIFCESEEFLERLNDQLDELENVPEDCDYNPEASVQLGQVIEFACNQIYCSSAEAIDIPHLVMGILNIDDSWASYLLKEALDGRDSDFLGNLIGAYELDNRLHLETGKRSTDAAWRKLVTCMNEHYQQHNPRQYVVLTPEDTTAVHWASATRAV